MILPHAPCTPGDVNRAALVYNAPLARAPRWEVPSALRQFEGLYLQSVKQSEDGKKTVCRLIETDGRRGKLKLESKVTVTDLLERPLYETDELCYKPFEILTVAF